MNSNIIKLGDKKIGCGQPVYIVFEAGPTHDGFETAKKLVDMAAEAGADAIKFQILRAEKIVSSRDVQFSYTRLVNEKTQELEEVTEPLLDILQRREMKWEEWTALIKYCRKKGIEFFSTATDEEELSFLNANSVNTVKICSGDVNYHYFLRQAAQYKWSIQLDTGASSLGEIETAIDVLQSEGCHNIIINHCPSGYPAHLESINLRVIQTLKQMFPYPVAFSDHSPGFEMDIAAVAMGANMIEKTITLDRTIRSPEHIMSLNPESCQSFVETIRDLEIAQGATRRVLSEEEKLKCINIRRSLFAACKIKKGEQLTQSMIHYARPGDGIPANLDYTVIGREAKKDIMKGTKLHIDDFI
ncbi:MAG: N-acetylneuraminate synthase family protein [Desulfobacterales bacterium]|jgi:sialic acid synthase SpsE